MAMSTLACRRANTQCRLKSVVRNQTVAKGRFWPIADVEHRHPHCQHRPASDTQATPAIASANAMVRRNKLICSVSFGVSLRLVES